MTGAMPGTRREPVSRCGPRSELRAASGRRRGAPRPGEVQERLVEREPLHGRRVAVEHVEELVGDRRVVVHPRLHDDELRARAHRPGHRHGAPDAELAGLVAGREHDAALHVPADHDGFPFSSGLSRISTDA